MTRVGVVGHTELVTFAELDAWPAEGEIVHARRHWDAAAGGGAIIAVILAELAGSATLRTALGDDADGERCASELMDRGVELHAVRCGEPTRRAFTHLTRGGERTITVLGERLEPLGADPLEWEDVAAHDAVLVTAGDAAAIRRARDARVLLATPRLGDALIEARVELDVLVGSELDPGEDLDMPVASRAVVRTRGADGGTWTAADGTSGEWHAVAPPGEPRDAFGCGDGFAAALTLALAEGATMADACARGAAEGARRLTLAGPYGRP